MPCLIMVSVRLVLLAILPVMLILCLLIGLPQITDDHKHRQGKACNKYVVATGMNDSEIAHKRSNMSLASHALSHPH